MKDIRGFGGTHLSPWELGRLLHKDLKIKGQLG